VTAQCLPFCIQCVCSSYNEPPPSVSIKFHKRSFIDHNWVTVPTVAPFCQSCGSQTAFKSVAPSNLLVVECGSLYVSEYEKVPKALKLENYTYTITIGAVFIQPSRQHYIGGHYLGDNRWRVYNDLETAAADNVILFKEMSSVELSRWQIAVLLYRRNNATAALSVEERQSAAKPGACKNCVLRAYKHSNTIPDFFAISVATATIRTACPLLKRRIRRLFGFANTAAVSNLTF
jgi:hypothetical protein